MSDPRPAALRLAHGPVPPRMVRLGKAYAASTAVVVGDVHLGEDSSIWYGCVVRGDSDRIVVGASSNVQDLSVLHADTGVPNEIGHHVTIGHGAVVHGRRIGDGCLIGIGAIVLGGAEIGDGCLVAAGAVVKEKALVPPRSLLAGVPARVVRELSREEAEALLLHAAHYVELARSHVARDERT